MIPKELTVTFGSKMAGTRGPYEPLHFELTLAVVLEEGEDPMITAREIHTQLAAEVREQARLRLSRGE